MTQRSDSGCYCVAIRIAVVRRADSGGNEIDGVFFAMTRGSDSEWF